MDEERNQNGKVTEMALDGATDAEIADKLQISREKLDHEWKEILDAIRATDHHENVEGLLVQLLREAQQALKSEKDQLALVLAKPDDKAVLTLGLSGLITGASSSAERILGVPTKSLPGMPIDYILAERMDGLETSTEEMTKAEQGHTVTSTREHRRADNTTFAGEHCLVAIIGATGHVSGFVREIRDISQRRVHEIKIEQLNTTIALLVDP
jgi:PAS domain S-box-containing protein